MALHDAHANKIAKPSKSFARFLDLKRPRQYGEMFDPNTNIEANSLIISSKGLNYLPEEIMDL